MRDKPRILLLDIETKPAIVYSFGIRDQHINHGQIKEDGGTICVGLKWFGDRGVTVLSEWDHGYVPMLEGVHAAICEADAVCTYNGAKFDLPKLTGNFLLAGMDPPPPLPTTGTSGISLLERAALCAREVGELPPHANLILGMMALSAIAILRTSPEDEAERLEHIARAARRRT